jgi:hypothetical protein
MFWLRCCVEMLGPSRHNYPGKIRCTMPKLGCWISNRDKWLRLSNPANPALSQSQSLSQKFDRENIRIEWDHAPRLAWIEFSKDLRITFGCAVIRLNRRKAQNEAPTPTNDFPGRSRPSSTPVWFAEKISAQGYAALREATSLSVYLRSSGQSSYR